MRRALLHAHPGERGDPAVQHWIMFTERAMETNPKQPATIDGKTKRKVYVFGSYLEHALATGYSFTDVKKIDETAFEGGVEILTVKGRERNAEIDVEMSEVVQKLNAIDYGNEGQPIRGDAMIFTGYDEDEKLYIIATVSASPHDTASDDVDNELNASGLGSDDNPATSAGTDGGTTGPARGDDMSRGGAFGQAYPDAG